MTSQTDPHWRDRLAAFADSAGLRNAILVVIVINAAVLGMETSERLMAQAGPLLIAIDRVCLAIFVAEIALKLVAHGWHFFRRGWNLFDFAVVAVALVPAGQGFAVLRALRVLRVLRLISMAPTLRRVVQGFISALPGMGSVFLLMGMIFYIASVMATTLFGETHPQWFGTLGQSGYTLFQIMTLESWSMGIVRPLMETHPQAWAFFVPFILITTFAVVNLVVGLIVNAMQSAHAEEAEAATEDYRVTVLAKLERIEARLAQIEAARAEDGETRP